MVSRHWLYFGGFLLAGVLLIGAGLMGLLDALSVLSGGVPNGGVRAAGDARGSRRVGRGRAGARAARGGPARGTVVSVLRSASIPRDDLLVAVVEWLERPYPPLRWLDVADRVEPTTGDRRRRLTERYVEGEIDEERFEREMAALMEDDHADGEARSGSGTSVDAGDRP